MAFTSKQVLVISRTSVSRMRLGTIFKRLGFEPLIAEAATEGIDLARKHSPSLIFFDTDLPKQELHSVLLLLKSESSTKDLPLIITTNRRNARDQQSLLVLGCTEVISKPVDVTQVFLMVGRVFGLMRKSLRVPVLFGVVVATETYEKTLDCMNISDGGMFLAAEELIPEKTVAQVKFALPFRNDELKLKVEVARTVPATRGERGSGMGVKFLDISEQEKQELRLFIQQAMVGDMFWEHQ